ncbi:uncharacterized protein LODBEIA_P19350 [Lodderomyces beijingensis]|uniref:Mitochondrial zinc maintenance protein 1, mitochondrial n=1 Tax=Lodderomyces beijingensis TaxID=1775926 RepID=A0ABP0ZLE4_9ASCO
MIRQVALTARSPNLARNYTTLRETWQSTKTPLKRAAMKLNRRTGEFLAEGINLAQHPERAAHLRSDYAAKKRVADNIGRGNYTSLQNKGKLVESEQCRADDGL